jgi:hypothetical protein
MGIYRWRWRDERGGRVPVLLGTGREVTGGRRAIPLQGRCLCVCGRAGRLHPRLPVGHDGKGVLRTESESRGAAADAVMLLVCVNAAAVSNRLTVAVSGSLLQR